MTNDNLLFTESQFADFIDKSVSWARLQRRLGRSPAYVRIGRTPMYPREAIANWMSANSIAPGAKRPA